MYETKIDDPLNGRSMQTYLDRVKLGADGRFRTDPPHPDCTQFKRTDVKSQNQNQQGVARPTLEQLLDIVLMRYYM